jgi:hypothetical protein
VASGLEGPTPGGELCIVSCGMCGGKGVVECGSRGVLECGSVGVLECGSE